MYLGYQNNKVVMIAESKTELENMPCIRFDKIEECSREIELVDGEYLFTDEEAYKTKKNALARLKREELMKLQADELKYDYEEALAKEAENAEELKQLS